ncbi:uncharacterized protein N7446_009771 [Penicillium canescens]|uniref:Uncharacterized protein n=1 Tax=Penicillium canescens TaxID=5083 RepID=A0AAD6I6X2_PENCN|nr:uncharacterized protein N7446_009771 [Penicillium canescens]KAJ6035012.1 hypothetical protein N7460_009187 [Penicillium canescens]KAJ6046674.1 hypothetical protein N7444_007928 [Penicillium canescens]KAJ6053759.1 hypothetical protein N7446_009771 [Penicillium canescens]
MDIRFMLQFLADFPSLGVGQLLPSSILYSFTQSATYGVLNPGTLLVTKTSRMLITHGNDVDGTGTTSVVRGGHCKSYCIKA